MNSHTKQLRFPDSFKATFFWTLNLFYRPTPHPLPKPFIICGHFWQLINLKNINFVVVPQKDSWPQLFVDYFFRSFHEKFSLVFYVNFLCLKRVGINPNYASVFCFMRAGARRGVSCLFENNHNLLIFDGFVRQRELWPVFWMFWRSSGLFLVGKFKVNLIVLKRVKRKFGEFLKFFDSLEINFEVVL